MRWFWSKTRFIIIVCTYIYIYIYIMHYICIYVTEISFCDGVTMMVCWIMRYCYSFQLGFNSIFQSIFQLYIWLSILQYTYNYAVIFINFVPFWWNPVKIMNIEKITHGICENLRAMRAHCSCITSICLRMECEECRSNQERSWYVTTQHQGTC